jgi:hypothetical protein
MDGGATRRLLAGACLALALGSAWAQMDAHQAQMKYEQSQREWREQEQARINEQIRQSNERIGRQSSEAARNSGESATSSGGAGPSTSYSGGAGGSAAAEIERARRRLEREPPLPPAKNPLLGQWRLEKARAAPKGGLAELNAMLSGGVCQMLLGDGIWDFRPKSMHGIDRGIGETELDKVEYRGNAKTVAVLPQRMFRLMLFEFDSPRRIRFLGQDCVMVRVGEGGGAAAAAGGGTAVAALAERPAGAQRATAQPSPEVCRRTLMDRFGAARESEVRQALQARFRETLVGTVPGTAQLRLDARGSACDDPRINAVLYDFDAAGLLHSLTLVWARPPGPAPAPIFSERAKVLAAQHGLAPPQSPSRLQGASTTARIVLQDLPERSLLLEAYAKPR